MLMRSPCLTFQAIDPAGGSICCCRVCRGLPTLANECRNPYVRYAARPPAARMPTSRTTPITFGSRRRDRGSGWYIERRCRDGGGGGGGAYIRVDSTNGSGQPSVKHRRGEGR